ncbi:hypothetical protein Trydic_g15818 [Trypoxylus dichotomus]
MQTPAQLSNMRLLFGLRAVPGGENGPQILPFDPRRDCTVQPLGKLGKDFMWWSRTPYAVRHARSRRHDLMPRLRMLIEIQRRRDCVNWIPCNVAAAYRRSRHDFDAEQHTQTHSGIDERVAVRSKIGTGEIGKRKRSTRSEGRAGAARANPATVS